MARRSARKYDEDRRQNLFVVSVIVLSFVVTLGLSFLFSGKGFLSLAGLFDKESTRSFYAVAVGGYEDMTLARSTAELIKSRGGAGYIIKNADDSEDKIEIVFAVYKEKAVAESVIDSLDNGSAYVKEIVVKEGGFSWCDKELKSTVKTALDYFDVAFDEMYFVSNSLNDNTMSTSDAKTKMRVLYTQIEDIKSAFYQNAQSQDSGQITEIKLALITTLALLDGIEYGSQAKTCASIRYALVQTVLTYKSLMQTM